MRQKRGKGRKKGEKAYRRMNGIGKGELNLPSYEEREERKPSL